MAEVVRVYLTGRLMIERGTSLVSHHELPGRQGRLALAYLTLHRTRLVPRDELLDALWATPPPSADGALSALISKLRNALSRVGIDGAAAVDASAGCYQLRLPADSVVDVERATNSLDRAEGALRAGDLNAAWSGATVATAVLRRPLLPGEDAEWLTVARTRQRDLLLRAFDCVTEVWLRRGDAPLAVATAKTALELAPFRESGYRRLMRAHAAAGDRAEALRVYESCRTLLRTELGANPSPETEALYREVLG